MYLKITPATKHDKIEFIAMPTKKNIPVGHPDWKEVICKRCGAECWETPLHAATVQERGGKCYCTECVLRIAAGEPEDR